MSRIAPLNLTAIPRNSIESSRHASIDASLKDLKTASRRVATFSTHYHTELKLLERIYYKGKNQHRSALFWRKVSEIRRFGTRVVEINLPGLVEGMHCSFHETEDKTSSKLFRVSWKLVPDSKSCISLLMRLSSVCLLVDQTRARFRVAYEAFTRQMRTATFIPLVMALISITSRLYFLVSELREILALLWQAVTRILDTIAESDNKRHKISFPLDPFGLSEAMVSSRAGAAKTKRGHKRDAASTGFPEDFGSIVSRDPHIAPSGLHTPKAPSIAKAVGEVRLSATHQEPSGFTETPSPYRPGSAVSMSTLHNMPCQVKDVTDVSSNIEFMAFSEPLCIRRSTAGFEGPDSEQRLAGTKRKVKRVKTKTHPDEIDDIFGF